MALRIFATVAGFVLFGLGLYYMTADMKSKEDRDRGLFVAFGPATPTSVELELPVTDLMVKQEPFGFGSPYRNSQEWCEAHFQLLDAKGTKLAWQSSGHATHSKGPSAGISDRFMMFKLVPGAKYTLKYTPSVADGFVYATDLVAPSGAVSSQRQLSLPRQ